MPLSPLPKSALCCAIALQCGAALSGAGEIDRSVVTDADRQFWSFRPVVKPDVPLAGDAWVRSPIDGFVLQAIRAAGQAPAAETSKRLWMRRVSFDLIGLPPSAQEVEAFEADGDPDAYARVIDRLLASPRYGERWASHWLDGVRYVEEVGYYNFGGLGWRYRDWVIRALNTDMPYDQFIVHQIAGDLMPNPTSDKVYADGIIATGVLCMGNYDDQESDKEQLYAEVADDQIDVVTRQFLGLTVSCARCHDHKFDPIPTRDYYAMAGIFMSTRVLGTESRIGAKRLKVPIHTGEDPQRKAEFEQEQADLERQLNELDKNSVAFKKLEERVKDRLKRVKEQPGVAMAAQEGGYSNSRHKEIGDMPIYLRGNYRTPGEVVPRGVLQVIAGDHGGPIGERTQQSGRLELARWIADPKNPLTARVMVNRVWQQHFGHGLVRTPSNFGALGERPTHPELLDWLAARFVEDGWSLKQLHREIVLSATFRQQSNVPAAVEADPENRLLARYERRRLGAEQIHDSLLFVSGRLQLDAARGDRARAIFTHTGHLRPWRFGQVFDAPPTGTMLAKRGATTTAPQSLFLLNDKAAIEAARGFNQVLDQSHDDIADKISAAYLALFARLPTAEEAKLATAYLGQAEKPWTLYHVLLCSNEFLHVE